MTAALEARVAMLERMVGRLQRRMGAPFALTQSTLAPNDTGVVQTVQLRLDPLSLRDGVPVLYDYGFTGCPPIGANFHVAYIDGDRSKAVAIASGHQTYRLTGLAPGDSAQYDSRGAYVWFTPNGIVINAAGQNLTIENAPTVTSDATLFRVKGDIIDNYGTNAHSVAGMRAIYDTHTHGDVMNGGDHTAVPDQEM
jgi:phage baseplate assembly protein V